MEIDDEPPGGEVDRLIAAISGAALREDCRHLAAMMGEVTGAGGRLWGPSVIGFGQVHYRYASGREGDAPKIGFSPRPRRITLYLMSGMVGYDDLLDRLGTHSRGKSCIYIRRLDDVDQGVLRQLMERCLHHLDQTVHTRGAIPRMSEMPPWVDD